MYIIYIIYIICKNTIYIYSITTERGVVSAKKTKNWGYMANIIYHTLIYIYI